MLEKIRLSIGGFSANLLVIDLEMSLASTNGVPALVIPLTSFSWLNFSEFPLLFKTVKSDKEDDCFCWVVSTVIMYNIALFIFNSDLFWNLLEAYELIPQALYWKSIDTSDFVKHVLLFNWILITGIIIYVNNNYFSF